MSKDKHPPEIRWPPKTRAVTDVRVGDTERDVIVGRLNQALSDGELTLQENIERVNEAMQARYITDLARLIEDLPDPPPTDLDRFRAWLGRRDTNVDFWLAGIPTGLLIAVVPGCFIAGFKSGIGPFEQAFIAVTVIIGTWIVLMSIVLACRADEKDRRDR